MTEFAFRLMCICMLILFIFLLVWIGNNVFITVTVN